MLDLSCYANPLPRISTVFPESGTAAEPLALACRVQIDPGQEHGQLRRLEFDAILGDRLGHLEAPFLKPLVPDRQTVAVKIEYLDPIPATVEEEEEMAGQEFLVEAFLNQARKAVE